MLIHIDGFDSYSSGSDLAYQYTSSLFPNIGTTSGRFAAGGVTFNSYQSYISKIFSTGITEIWTGFAFKMTGYNSLATFLSFVSSSGIEAILNFSSSSGVWQAWRGDYVTQIGSNSPATTISLGVWHYLEFHYKIDTSVGIVELWLDNHQLFSYTGQNTSYYGNTSFNALWLGGNGFSAPQSIFDDWYILNPNIGSFNTSRLGDSRIQTLRPSSDAGPNNGTPSSGSLHYAMVNAPQNDGGSTYITLTGTSGQEELFGMTSLPVTPTTIYGAKVLNYAKKTDAGSLNTNSIISSNSVVANSNVQGLLTTFSGISGIFESDPSTGIAWSPAGINAADCGFKIS